jgi:hypothetical protein
LYTEYACLGEQKITEALNLANKDEEKAAAILSVLITHNIKVFNISPCSFTRLIMVYHTHIIATATKTRVKLG